MGRRSVSRRAQRVWDRLTSWYGTRFTEAYGKNPPEDWSVLIDRTDDERLDQGMRTVRGDSPVHPPTLGQLESAIPKKQTTTGPSVPERLCEFVIKKRQTCWHQRMQPWTYFGPITEYPPSKSRETPISNPNPRGVVVPACSACNMPSIRVTLDDLRAQVGPGVAA